MGDTWYPNLVPFPIDEFDQNLYPYYWKFLNPYRMIQVNFNTNSADSVQGKNFMHNDLGRNSVRERNK